MRVRLSTWFFEDLDAQLPADRTERLPSRRDFEVADLLDIVEQVAASWAGLPPFIDGRPDYRQAIVACRTVYAAVIDAQAVGPDVVELVAIRLQIEPPGGAWPGLGEDSDNACDGDS